MKKVITAQDIQEARKAGLTVFSIPPGTLVTPQAQDDARKYGIALQRESAVAVQAAPPAVPVAVASREAQAMRNLMAAVAVAPTTQPSPPAPAAIPGGFVAELISRQVAQQLGNTADMARINAVVQDVLGEQGVSAPAHPAQPVMPPTLATPSCGVSFTMPGTTIPGAPQAPAQNPVQSGTGAVLVRGRDALSGRSAAAGAVTVTDSLLPDAKGPGIGYLQLADSSFEWTFATDEVLLVLEGELRLSGAGLDLKAGPGDALRLSAGLACTLTATGRVSCVYSAWPK